MVARSLLEEILYVRQKSCDCGVYFVLLEREEGPVHRLRAQCRRCGMVRVFQLKPNPGFLAEFDPLDPIINPDDSPSELIDPVGWFILARQLSERLARAQHNRRKGFGKQPGALARSCLKELLKFYPRGEDFPKDDLFYEEGNRRFFRSKRQEFRKDRILRFLERIDERLKRLDFSTSELRVELLPANVPARVLLAGSLQSEAGTMLRWAVDTLQRCDIEQLVFDTSELTAIDRAGRQSLERCLAEDAGRRRLDMPLEQLEAELKKRAAAGAQPKTAPMGGEDISLSLVVAFLVVAFLVGGLLAWLWQLG